MRLWIIMGALSGAFLFPLAATAADQATVVSSCGSLPASYPSGTLRPLTQDVNGNLCMGQGSGTGATSTTVSNGSGAGAANVRQMNSTPSSGDYGLDALATMFVYDPSSGVIRPVRTGFNLSGAVGNDIPAVASGGQYNLGLPTLSGGQFAPLQLDAGGRLILSPGSLTTPALNVASAPVPSGTSAISGSGNGTTGAVSATLAGAVGKLTYLCGIDITSSGTGTLGPVTTTGLVTNLTWQISAGTNFSRTFSPCLPTGSGNTAIVVTTTADSSATGVAVNLNGFQY